MATNTNHTVWRAEHWILQANCKETDGSALDLTGADVQFRVGRNATLHLDLASPDEIEITDAAAGLVTIVVSPEMQEEIGGGVYPYELRVVLPSGVASLQAWGNLTVNRSLFSRFPAPDLGTGELDFSDAAASGLAILL